MNEITTLLQEAKAYAQSTGSWIILPLHSALSIEEQDKVSSGHCGNNSSVDVAKKRDSAEK